MKFYVIVPCIYLCALISENSNAPEMDGYQYELNTGS